MKFKNTLTTNEITAINYCYKKGDKAVFLNRKDDVIKEFTSYEDAFNFAKNNLHLID